MLQLPPWHGTGDGAALAMLPCLQVLDFPPLELLGKGEYVSG